MKKIGWVPVCIKVDPEDETGVLGPWVCWAKPTKREVAKDVRESAQGFKFKIVPCFVGAK